MAYLKCPDCRMDNPVPDAALDYTCFGCWQQVVFTYCSQCHAAQSISARWHSYFTCGACGGKSRIPPQRFYSNSAKARTVSGFGYTYPRT
jgi:hypothetical protein